MSFARFTQVIPLLVMGLALVFAAQLAQAQTETVLYNFTGGSDGGKPVANLTSDGKGNFYGTTTEGGLKFGPDGYGTVFELSPNGNGGWNETVLYTFCPAAPACPDGAFPYSSVIFDSAGNLYGIAYAGGAYDRGVVFELNPAQTSWAETVLYSFTGGSDGGSPTSNLIMDPSGNLFGTNSAGVFELKWSGGGWAEQVIYRPQNYPQVVTGLTMDAAGNIFGVGYSSAFELSPNGNGGWNPTVLHNFLTRYFLGPDPIGAPALDKAGNFYGATYHGGANKSGKIYEVSLRRGKWTLKTLYSFGGHVGDGSNPDAGLVLDASGNIYGTTLSGGGSGYGTVFELVAPIGKGSYQEKVLWSFNGTDGRAPYASLILDSAGNLYGTTRSGGSSGPGVVFKVTP